MMADTKKSAVPQRTLLDIMADIDGQPNWRSNAKKAHAYYDGDQLDPRVMAVLQERGQPETMHNLIAPTVDGVLGMEAKTRTDLLVTADEPDDDMELLAEAVNAEFADAARLGRLDKARSEAYAGQIKCGLGVVEVYRSPNPFGPRYRIRHVPRDEVFWDWHAQQPDWSDCRWVMRQRWIDVDELKTLVPGKAAVLEQAANNWHGFVDTQLAEGLDPHLVSAWEEFKGWTREDTEYLSQNRKRIRLQIIYLRVMERKPVLVLASGRRVEYDRNNLLHATAVGMGRASLMQAQVSRVVESWYAGPHHLGDRDCSALRGCSSGAVFWFSQGQQRRALRADCPGDPGAG